MTKLPSLTVPSRSRGKMPQTLTITFATFDEGVRGHVKNVCIILSLDTTKI